MTTNEQFKELLKKRDILRENQHSIWNWYEKEIDKIDEKIEKLLSKEDK